jgi:hypothetical protein
LSLCAHGHYLQNFIVRRQLKSINIFSSPPEALSVAKRSNLFDNPRDGPAASEPTKPVPGATRNCSVAGPGKEWDDFGAP